MDTTESERQFTNQDLQDAFEAGRTAEADSVFGEVYYEFMFEDFLEKKIKQKANDNGKV